VGLSFPDRSAHRPTSISEPFQVPNRQCGRRRGCSCRPSLWMRLGSHRCGVGHSRPIVLYKLFCPGWFDDARTWPHVDHVRFDVKTGVPSMASRSATRTLCPSTFKSRQVNHAYAVGTHPGPLREDSYSLVTPFARLLQEGRSPHLAKVRLAGSSPVVRSKNDQDRAAWASRGPSPPPCTRS